MCSQNDDPTQYNLEKGTKELADALVNDMMLEQILYPQLADNEELLDPIFAKTVHGEYLLNQEDKDWLEASIQDMREFYQEEEKKEIRTISAREMLEDVTSLWTPWGEK